MGLEDERSGKGPPGRKMGKTVAGGGGDGANRSGNFSLASPVKPRGAQRAEKGARTLPARLDVEMLRKTRPKAPAPARKAWATKTRPGSGASEATRLPAADPRELASMGASRLGGVWAAEQAQGLPAPPAPDTANYYGAAPSSAQSDARPTAGSLPRANSLPKLPLGSKAAIPTQSIFERDSPRARATLRSFLRNFLEANGADLRLDIDLAAHALATGTPITNAMVQEICVMQNDLRSLDLSGGREVTDVGLWAIARHCTKIEDLKLSGCDEVTKVGLRSVALRCQRLRTLEFQGCKNLDDEALRTLAGGCWDLETLNLNKCPKITDAGLAEMARVCRNLTYLNVSDCAQVGEFGDTALLELGKFCSQLATLDMFGCRHVRDKGLIAVAKGCTNLETLRLTGCREVTGSAVSALAKNCHQLTDLSLAGCEKILNKDLSVLARSCSKLQKLDISECSEIHAVGLHALVHQCTTLKELNLERCLRVSDDGLAVIADAVKLQTLNLSNCAAISERGVEDLAQGCTGLSYLNITGCTQISRRFLMNLIADLRFSEPAHRYYGYQPKPDAAALRLAAEEHNRRERAAVAMQRIIRGHLGRGGAWARRQEWVIQHMLPRMQARIRGTIQRRIWKKDRIWRLENRAASKLAGAWRGLQSRRLVAKIHAAEALRREHERVARMLQRAFRGRLSRRLVWTMREDLAASARIAAQEQARLEVAARSVQGAWRARKGREISDALRKVRDEKLSRARLEDKAARYLQRVYRGHQGVVEYKAKREAYEQMLQEWRAAQVLAAAWRGSRGRKRAREERLRRQHELEVQMAIRLQTAWRCNRARHLASMARSLNHLREEERKAACKLQAIWRGRRGKAAAERKRNLLEEVRRRERGALGLQRIFRGHKGREGWEVAFHIKRLETMARPLFERQAALTKEKEDIAKEAAMLAAKMTAMREDTDELRLELSQMLGATKKYWDSHRITGAPQRFLSKFLKVRLTEQLQEQEALLAEDQDHYNQLVVQARTKQRLLRQVHRELSPLTEGMSLKTKRDRSTRLREKVRLEKWAATLIQRCFRGIRLRTALFSWYRDYWIEVVDETTGDVYFYNTWSEEVRWAKPLEMTLLATSGQPVVRAGANEWVEQFDDEKGLPFWYNETSGEYRWEKPAELEGEEEEQGMGETGQDWFNTQSGNLMGTGHHTRDIGEGGWQEMMDPQSGQTYYQHAETGETKWSLTPREAAGKASKRASQPQRRASTAHLG